MKHTSLLLLLLLLIATGCEKPFFENAKTASVENANLRLTVGGFNVVPFDVTRTSADIAAYCSRLNFVLYKDGKKVKAVNQQSADDNFGNAALTVEPGSYQVLVLAHSANGNPVLSDPTKIQFSNDNGYTDTFFWYGDVTVGEATEEKQVVLDRCTAMFRFITTDNVPFDVARMRFYYTGGSGALDATTGFGCVNSKQVTFFDVDDEMVGHTLRLEIYTIPKASSSALKILVQAFDAADNLLYESELDAVPIEMNKITEYTGQFFVDNSDGGTDKGETDNNDDDHLPAFSIRLNTEWAGTILGTF